MSLLRMVLNELLREQSRPLGVSLGKIYDQHFGLGVDDRALPGPAVRFVDPTVFNVPALHAGYFRPWRHLAMENSGVSSVNANDKEFSIHLDVNHFKPDELKVTIDDDGYVKVEGNHEEKNDQHGFISRHFVRRYKLPEEAIRDTLTSNLSSDGILTLQAAIKPKEVKDGREIKIVQTDQPALKKGDDKATESEKTGA